MRTDQKLETLNYQLNQKLDKLKALRQKFHTMKNSFFRTYSPFTKNYFSKWDALQADIKTLEDEVASLRAQIKETGIDVRNQCVDYKKLWEEQQRNPLSLKGIQCKY